LSTGLSTGSGGNLPPRVDPVVGRLLAWRPDGAPGRQTAFARGRQAASGTWVPVFVSSAYPHAGRDVTAGELGTRRSRAARMPSCRSSVASVTDRATFPQRTARSGSAGSRLQHPVEGAPWAPGTPLAGPGGAERETAPFHAQRCAMCTGRPRCRRVVPTGRQPRPGPGGFPRQHSRRDDHERQARRPSWRRPGAASSTA
jgi:hypothetical protein